MHVAIVQYQACDAPSGAISNSGRLLNFPFIYEQSPSCRWPNRLCHFGSGKLLPTRSTRLSLNNNDQRKSVKNNLFLRGDVCDIFSEYLEIYIGKRAYSPLKFNSSMEASQDFLGPIYIGRYGRFPSGDCGIGLSILCRNMKENFVPMMQLYRIVMYNLNYFSCYTLLSVTKICQILPPDIMRHIRLHVLIYRLIILASLHHSPIVLKQACFLLFANSFTVSYSLNTTYNVSQINIQIAYREM